MQNRCDEAAALHLPVEDAVEVAERHIQGRGGLLLRPAVEFQMVFSGMRLHINFSKSTVVNEQVNKSTEVNFADQLRRLIEHKGHSQRDLAALTGVTPAAVNKWLKGSIPQGDVLHKIASIYDVSIQGLLNGNATPGSTSITRAMLTAKVPDQAEAFVWKGRALAAEQQLADLKKAIKEGLEGMLKKL